MIIINIAVCIDENGGMLFNSRRQSRDRELISDFLKTANKNKVLIKPFSKILFEEKNVYIDENCLEIAEENDYCFIEDESIIPYSHKINRIIIYKWNRNYPNDFCFEMPRGFVLETSYNFKGSSHQIITKEIYKNAN